MENVIQPTSLVSIGLTERFGAAFVHSYSTSELQGNKDSLGNVTLQATFNPNGEWQNIYVIEERTRICDPIFGVRVDTEFVYPGIREFGIYIYLGWFSF